MRVSWESLQRTHSSHPTLTNLGRSATRISVLFAAAAQQQKEQGEEEMALKAFANAPAPRATSELFFAFYFNNAATPVFISCSTSVLPFDF